MIGNYTDSADTGFDFLCSICFDAHDDGYYVTDVLYTKRPMEYTEPAQANMVKRRQTCVSLKVTTVAALMPAMSSA